MIKRLLFLLLVLCFALKLSAKQTSIKTTSTFFNIVKITDPVEKRKKLVKFLNGYFGTKLDTPSVNDLADLDQLLQQYNVENREAYHYFAESVKQNHDAHPSEAVATIKKAIEIAGNSSDHYLLYSFLYRLAFFQTVEGNTIDAVSSFRAAKKEAITTNDFYSQVIVDVNISDIYYKNNFYSQSLTHLDQAYNIVKNHHITDPRLYNIIYYNKAENYFRLDSLDSLQKYHQLFNSPKIQPYKLTIFRNRTAYFITLLKHQYPAAIKRLRELQRDTAYKFDDTDLQNLADAYYKSGQLDSAKAIINRLMVSQSQNNHPETKFHLYEVLAGIAEQQHDEKQAAYNFKMALQQSEDHIARLTKVGVISSKMNVDEIQTTYMQREETYKRERLLLMFTIIVAILAIGIVAMFYRAAKQKRYYEKLLFDSKKEELAFINSHEVRRYLSNILGIINVIKNSDNKTKEYMEAEEHLLSSAESLDEAIRNISDKLDD